MELVDILIPPDFHKSGITKPREQALADGEWVGTFNLWIVQDAPIPQIVYQQRSPNSTWEPNKLDVSSGGFYQAGEELADGVREAKEELGCDFKFADLFYLGRKLYVNRYGTNPDRHTITHVFMIKDNTPIESFNLDPVEVSAIVTCPIAELLKTHTDEKYQFKAQGLDNHHQAFTISVNQDSFPYNWDNYHYKIALIAQRFLYGEKNLIY
jgi:ADP-ribose pyrophosphatase YjhB (NUDIX family)